MQKYHNQKMVVDGKKFDSQREKCRYQVLAFMQKVGKISDLKTQVKYELIPTIREPDTVGPRGGIRKGKVIEQGVSYIADFVYKDADGNTVVEDAKGFRTADYVIKRKLMMWVHGIRIQEI